MTRWHARTLLLTLAVGFVMAFAGCGGATIANTDVEDTSDNRDILEFCERYRNAVQNADVGAVLAMVSPRYLDNNGTATGEDDIDYEKLRQKLQAWRDHSAHDVRYEIRYRRVVEQHDRIFVDYEFTGSYRLTTPTGERWEHPVEKHRLTLVRDGEDYRILAGL